MMQLATKRLTQRKVGWIGVDVGNSAVKVAQVARTRHGWGLVASAIVPRQLGNLNDESEDATDDVGWVNEFQVARSLQQGFRGRKVAASLPMSLCDVHRLDRDLEGDPSAMGVLRQTIETATQQSVSNVQCDFWSSPQSENKPAWTQALTVPRTWTDQLCADIHQAGWTCEAIDGAPLVMARAVNMIQADTPDAPLAALDWGSERATLCLIDGGRPTYVRCLKGVDLHRVIESLTSTLQVTEVEAQRLLEEIGMHSEFSEESRDIAQLVQETIAEPLCNIVEEVKRSVGHYQYLMRSPPPKTLYLLGGGAMVRDVDKYLSPRLKIDTQNWRLPTLTSNSESRDSRSDCMLATSVALSALAWEAS